MKTNLVKWAIQKNGRLTEKSLELINKIYGTEVKVEDFSSREYFENTQEGFKVFLVRDDDIPFLVSECYCDIGVCSEVIKEESGFKNFVTHKLGFMLCKLVYATQELVPEEDNKIVTKFPNLAEKIFGDKFEIVKLHGGTELACHLGISCRILELTQSGKSLERNNYRIIDVIKEYDTEIMVNDNNPRLAEMVFSKCL